MSGGNNITETIKDMPTRMSVIYEKLDMSRYKLGILLELFAVPPGCDGYNDPEDPAMLYLGVKTLLSEVIEWNRDITEDLESLIGEEKQSTTA